MGEIDYPLSIVSGYSTQDNILFDIKESGTKSNVIIGNIPELCHMTLELAIITTIKKSI